MLEQLRNALRRRDVLVAGNERWGDPRAKLLSGSGWERARDGICRSLRLERDPRRQLATMGAELDEAYRTVAEHLPANTAPTIRHECGRDRPHLAHEAASKQPRERIHERLTRYRDHCASHGPGQGQRE